MSAEISLADAAQRRTDPTVIEQLALLAEAEGGVARFRELLLGLAIRGGLSRHEDSDGTARDLLAEILNAQRQAFARGEIDVVTPSTAIADDEVPHGLAAGWAWARLSQVVHSIQIGPFGSLLHKSDYITAGTPLVNPANIRDGRIVPDAKKGVSRETLKRLANYRLRTGDVVMGRRGEMGKCAVVTSVEDGWLCGTGSLFVRPTGHVLSAFLVIWIRSRSVRRRLESESVGSTMNNLNLRVLNGIVLALPPLAEQKRIVAKVDQLMALCDDLEARQTKKRDTSTRLTKSALQALTTAEGPEEFDVAWKRVVENFDVLIDRAEKVGQLRKAIVALALRGCIVRPAARGAVEAGQRADPAVAEEVLEALPATWRWVTFDAVIGFGPKNGYSPKAVEHETAVKSLTLTATTSGTFDGRFFKYIDETIPEDSDLWLADGDVLIQRGNTIDYVGVAAVYRGPPRTFIYPDLMMKVRLKPDVDTAYVHMALNGPVARRFIMSRASGTSGSMPKINQTTVQAIPIPLPPLQDQRRIVAKVEELMKACDHLEASLRLAEERASELVEAVVQELAA